MFKYTNKELNLTSRPCKMSDFPFILDVYQKTVFINVAEFYQVDESMLINRFNKEYSTIYLIENKNEPVGFYQLELDSEKAYISSFFLHPRYHKRGIGKDLMLSIISYVKDKKCSEIILHVWENNSAFNFYKKIGFTKVSIQKHKYTMSLKI